MDKLTFEHWKSRIQESIFGIIFILFIVVIFSYAAYKASESVISKSEITGKLVGIHQIQSNTGSRYSIFVVQLANGEKVNIQPPDYVPFKKGKEIKITKTIKESGFEIYNYHSYVQ